MHLLCLHSLVFAVLRVKRELGDGEQEHAKQNEVEQRERAENVDRLAGYCRSSIRYQQLMHEGPPASPYYSITSTAIMADCSPFSCPSPG